MKKPTSTKLVSVLLLSSTTLLCLSMGFSFVGGWIATWAGLVEGAAVAALAGMCLALVLAVLARR